MNGHNKYEAEGFGKQDAKKGLKFISFPSVLMLQLKRFEFDYQKNQMNKIYDKFEYYNEIDLNNYIESTNGEIPTDEEFTLHSVVVHSGNAFAGHYYTYIKPGLDDKWLLFNDEIVKPAEIKEVFNYQFGGVTTNYQSRYGGVVEQAYLCEASAYILVYIRNKD